MRIRAVVSMMLLAVPVALDAQQCIPIRMMRRCRIAEADPPPMAPAIARQLAYRRMHLSVESYPLLSFMEAPAYVNGVSNWTTFGNGLRMDYRLNRFASATLDLTSTILGGPAQSQTVELGMRFHRERTESRAYPYLDVRAGYLETYRNLFPSINGIAIPGSRRDVSGYQYSRGPGAIVGAGTEYALTRRFSLTVGGSFVRSKVNAYGYIGPTPRGRADYMMSMYRFTAGLVFNPVRMITASGM